MSTLITGVSGQDGRILARMLSMKDDQIFGICRPGQKQVISKYCPSIVVFEIDLMDEDQLVKTLHTIKPTKIYNLAGFSSVNASWQNPTHVTRINSVVPTVILNWCLKYQPETRFVNASSSEIFGGTNTTPQNEETPLMPITPYGLSKGFAHNLIRIYRKQYGLFASNAILYNHESPLRDHKFVTRKISKAVAQIALGSNVTLELGDLQSKRDWGWAPDYVVGLKKMMEHDAPDDFVLATGQSHLVEDLVRFAFNRIGISDFSPHIRHGMQNDRPVDPSSLLGDSALAYRILGWETSTSLQNIIEQMVDFDIELLNNPNSQWFPNSGS